jgi:hypothetical protein
MTSRAELVQILKIAAAEMAQGDVGENSTALQLARTLIDRTPKLAVGALEVLIKEGLKARPDDDLMKAYMLVAAYAIEQARFDIENNAPSAGVISAQLRAVALKACVSVKVPSGLVLLISQLFGAAQLDVGPDFRAGLQQRFEAEADQEPTDEDIEAGENYFGNIASNCDNDEFAAYEVVREQLSAMPDKMRLGMVMSMLDDPNVVVRHAGLGFLFNDQAARRFTLDLLNNMTQPEQLISPVSLRRMQALQPWLPAEERGALAQAIASCRAAGGKTAAWPKTADLSVYASGLDGVGAQNIVIVVQDGTIGRGKKAIPTYAFMALLGKVGFGLRDAWGREHLTEPELNELMDRLDDATGLTATTATYAIAAVQYFLGMNVQAGTMPPFGLLAVAERCGWTELTPHAPSVEHLVRTLVDATDAKTRTPATRQRLLKTADWLDGHRMHETWFEDCPEVTALFAKKMSKDKRRQALLTGLLQNRRRRWAELMAWTAFAAQNAGPDSDWQQFAIVAEELLGDRPLADIALMQMIANQTIAAQAHTDQGLLFVG